MSKAGILSNRGDSYQTIVALDWALIVLSDPEFQWLEIDSTTYQVDDVVVGRSDGSVICCQCKKNQTDFKAWSLPDLEDELSKAFVTLVEDKKASVRFYSQSDFGDIAKLREYATISNNQADYLANITLGNTKINGKLAALIDATATNLSTYEFLNRTRFEVTPDFDKLEILLRERLRNIASNSNAAYDALLRQLGKLGARIEGNQSTFSRYRLTKQELEDILHQAGAMLVPQVSTVAARASIMNTSSIGRSWQRDIEGHRVLSPVLNDLLEAVDDKKRSVLLTGLPGSGKTCLILNLQEELERRSKTRTDLVPLFIQAREFADLATAQERQAQGLNEQWVAQAARLAEVAHVVVVIDSLDVLSIAREHVVLSYFLAQIDQLLLIPNVTVVAACRDFDRKYDSRIAARQWDCELRCLPLSWEAEILPLLVKLGINSSTIDEVTRELISNLRELALFVELVQRTSSFNVVTSQALAQRYLDTIIQNDPTLGDDAMQAIEAIANEMLSSRSLSISRQRLKTSPKVLRQLRSLNVLQDTHDGKITFGHQTLLDVLVISNAIRRNISINEFVSALPPVPFVRPSIRSFVIQLAEGDRREFRGQLRAVLTSKAAFHIRRLIAEIFAQLIPQEDDWSLIRDLRAHNREVFQVIYTKATAYEWCQFWLKYLIPVLKEERDVDGMNAHVNSIELWIKEDAAGVLSFWLEALSLDWLDNNRTVHQLCFSLSKFKTENLPLVVPLLEQLLDISGPDHNRLGHTIARCVSAGAAGDGLLWRYIAGDISDDDIKKYHFDKKLRCQPHDFGNKNDDFLKKRMMQSIDLLDLALDTIEHWSQVKSDSYNRTKKEYRSGFLSNTSYSDAHTEVDYRHVDAERILFDAVQAAILGHAGKNSSWWEKNRERLCFNPEGALCYFAVLALIGSPQLNIDLVSRLLCNIKFLEFELSHESSALIRIAFSYLDDEIQDAVMQTIQSVFDEHIQDEEKFDWIMVRRVGYLTAIPNHLRSEEAQVIIDTYEKKHGSFIRQPAITMRGGAVAAPFSFEEFLKISDDGVIHLLEHYAGHIREFDDYFIGGSREVGFQLCEASSRHPTRFLSLLSTRWPDIPKDFKDSILAGSARYVAYLHGNLQVNSNWVAIEVADATVLSTRILDELELHSAHWRLNESAAKALEACGNVIQDTINAERMSFLALGFSSLRGESYFSEDSSDWLTTGINMMSGNVAEGLMILASDFLKRGLILPELLTLTLRRFSSIKHPAIQALMLRRLAYFQSLDSEFGWELFYHTINNGEGLWEFAEPCLYYGFRNQFDIVATQLECIYRGGKDKDMDTWGRISALSVFSKHIDFTNFLEKLNELNKVEAWRGAASVWTNTGNLRQYREQCLSGIEAGLTMKNSHAMAVAGQVGSIFRDVAPPILLPVDLMRLYFTVIEINSENENRHHDLYGFDEWVNNIAQRDPGVALAIAEIYLAYVVRSKPYFYDHENHLVQLVTHLFAEAEEREEADQGAMLKRVVLVQDLLLSLGLTSINEWLKAAERQ